MSRGLIFFLHGLGGSGQATWQGFTDLIQRDPKLKQYDIHFYSYPTSLFRLPWSQKRPKIQTLSESVRSEINNRFPDRSDIILVCHSLGGLIGRKYLVEEVKGGVPLRVRGLLLYATPNTGAAIAAIGSLVSWRHNQLRQLCRDADVVRDLGNDWTLFKVAELIKIKYVAAGLDRVVDELSARESWGNHAVETVIDKGHIDIVKPAAPTDLSFLILKNFVLSLEQELEPPPTSLKHYLTDSGKRNARRRSAGSRFRVIGFDLDGTLLRGYEFSWTLVWKFLGVPDAVWREAKRKYVTGQRTFNDYKAWVDHDLRHFR
jgi:predicted alpha/beta hydrolase family esterase